MKTRIAPALRWIAATLFLCLGGSVLRPQDDNSNPNINTVPANIVILSGNHQLGIEWYLDAPLVVQVTDNYHNPLPKIHVSFSSDAGMLASDNTGTGYNLDQDCITDRNGCAQVFLGLCGPPGTTDHVTASIQSVIDGQSGTETKSVAFECFVPQLYVVSGDLQMGEAGSWLPAPLKVRLGINSGGTMYYAGAGLGLNYTVVNANSRLNSVPADSNASIALTAITDANGNAKIFLKPAGTNAGTPNSVTVTFSTYRGASVEQFNCYTDGILAIEMGDNQVGTSGTWLPIPLGVQMRNSSGTPMAIPGLPVTFEMMSGGGALAASRTGSGSTTTFSASTDSNGFAQVYLKLRGDGGAPDTVRATPGADGQSVELHGYAYPPVVLFSQGKYTSASNSTLYAQIGGPLSGNLTVKLNDATIAGSWQAGQPFSLTVPLNIGLNTFTLVVTDSQGYHFSSSTQITRESSGPQVTVNSPVDSDTVPANAVDVIGTYSSSSPMRSVTVNGQAAYFVGGTFSAQLVPLTSGSNTLSVVATDQAGNASTSNRTITASYSSGALPPVTLTAPNPLTGAAPLTVVFTPHFNVSTETVSSVVYHFNGLNNAAASGSGLSTLSHTFVQRGDYFPMVTVTTTAGHSYSSSGPATPFAQRLHVHVTSGTSTPLTVWADFGAALAAHDIEGTAQYFVSTKSDDWLATLRAMGPEDAAQMQSDLVSLVLVGTFGNVAEYAATVNTPQGQITFPVNFDLEDGEWKIDEF